MSQARYLIGDVFDRLRELPDNSVDLVFSSPPFLALRSYLPADHELKHKEIGSEPTPGEFIDTLLDVVVECRRVLAPHGSLVFELGDTFASNTPSGNAFGAAPSSMTHKIGTTQQWNTGAGGIPIRDHSTGGWPLDKSLCLIPQSFAWALSYGRNPFTGREIEPWRVRNVVAWCRPNPPVGALGDKFRPATSYLTVACMSRDRYFDLDAVRTEYKPGQSGAATKVHYDFRDGGGRERVKSTGKSYLDGAGAPPLDYWVIPTEPNGGGTFRRVRVPLDAAGDGIQRTASPSCPVHGSTDHPGSSAPDDERAGSESTRTGRNGDCHDPKPLPGLQPTSQTPARSGSTTASSDPARSRAAKPRSTASRKTAPAPATSLPGTPSAGSPFRTGDTSTSPASSAPGHDTPSSTPSEDGSGDLPGPRTPGRTTDTSPAPEACTCSYYVEIEVAQDSSNYAGIPEDFWVIPTHPFPGSHYATFPPALCIKPVEAMCPRRVCRVCGEPSRRITEQGMPDSSRPQTKRAMEIAEAAGLTPEHIAAIRAKGISGTSVKDAVNHGTDGNSSEVERLFAEARSVLKGYTAEFQAARPETTGWTDCNCGHEPHHDRRPGCCGASEAKWRPGVVLDPFAGSGTTLQVAMGHGRDAIGIDLDSRNAELAYERIGGLFLTIEQMRGVA